MNSEHNPRGVENTFEADYMYVTLCNLIETLGNKL